VFRLYHSNQLDVLKGILAYVLKTQPNSDPFIKEQVLVQSPGMAQWLKIELAKELSICANIEFPLPASFIWQVFVDLLDDVPKRSAFNKDAMAWNIMQRLPLHLARDEFSELAQYLADDDQLKIYQLAYKIADIYDQYLVYRPQWIAAWEQGSKEFCPDQPWQGLLWKDLVDTLVEGGQSHYHRANLYQYLIEQLDADGPNCQTLPKRIFVFGISALPPRYLQALHSISQHCEVHFFINNPCRTYWGDIVDAKWLAKLNQPSRQQVNPKTFADAGAAQALLASEQTEQLFDLNGELIVGNPLLASMGKLGRDNQHLLGELPCVEIEAFVEATSANLLGHITNDILDLNDPCFIAKTSEDLSHSRHKTPISATDNSLVVHSCHSPMREVEVLYEQLLDMFESQPESDNKLTPKDIVVMMPDVNAYSPYIQAVFGMASGKRRIDFSISDRSAEQENPILFSFLTLLKAPLLRHTSAELFALLEVPAIMAKFELTAESIDTLKMWIEESGIRHGFEQDTSLSNSWQFGLNRMFKGYSQVEPDITTTGVELWQDIFAYSQSVGLGAELLGQLASFIEKIEQISQQLAAPRPFEQWQQAIESLLADFYADELQVAQEIQLIKDSLTKLADELSLAQFNSDISAEVLYEHLRSHLNQAQSSQRFLAGKLNFCTLMPMRSIPFKVVCLLGMNDGSYPRTIAPVGFDLMADDHQKGDRSRRDDDRYLFLEAMLSAQQRLYISYCGRSIKDNSPRNPSVLVTELLDYIEQGYVLDCDTEQPLAQSGENLLNHLVYQQPLTPFSREYFGTDPRLFSYQHDWRLALDFNDDPQRFFSEPLDQDDSLAILELHQLIRFYKQPSQYFLNQRLGVYFNDSTSDLVTNEPFHPDGLEGYQIKTTLLDNYLNNSADAASERIRAQGVLPHGHFSQLYLGQQTEVMAALADVVKPYLTSPEPDIEIDLTISNLTIQGWLKQHVGAGLIRYKSGKANIKFFIHCYIEHLCYCASSPNSLSDEPAAKAMILCAQDGQWQFGPMSVSAARERLAVLVDYYRLGQTQPLAFFINSGWAYLSALFEPKTGQLANDEKSINSALKKFEQAFNGSYIFSGEGSDHYIERCFGAMTPELQQQVIGLTLEILLPLRQLLEELGDD